jgi:NADH-quinone oxidoreductase subunit N
MTLTDVLKNCLHIIPELILVATLCVVALTDMFLPKEKSPNVAWIAMGGLVLALIAVLMNYGDHTVFGMGDNEGPIYPFSRMIVLDELGDFFKVFFLLGTMAVVLFSVTSVEIRDYRHGEYYTLMLAAVAGGSFLVSSNNLLMMVLSLETLSLCSYVLVGYVKHNRYSAEASLKYILYGSVASGVMLFGISYIYGMTGTLDVSKLLVNLAYRQDDSTAVLLAMVLVISGVGFKMAAVPFHFWAPDVYQGAPTPVTAFLAVVSKAAGFAVIYRVLLPLFAVHVDGGAVPAQIMAIRGPLLGLIEGGRLSELFWLLSVGTMTLGNLVALRQTNVKRLLAYSSIAHAGYLLMGLTVFNSTAMEAMLFYFVAYYLMNLGAFLVVIVMINKTGSEELSSFRGLIWRNPLVAVAMIAFLVSLTGIPPTAGFIGKLKIFEAVVGAGSDALAPGFVMTRNSLMYFSLAVIGGVNTVISLYYYMNIVKIMVFEKPEVEARLPIGIFDQVYMMVFFIPVTFLIVQFGPVLEIVRIFQR